MYPRSLINEFKQAFGVEATERFITIFAGMEIKVPSREDINKMQRDIDIYDLLSKAKDKEHFKILRRTLQAKLGMKKRKIVVIYKTMRKLEQQRLDYEKSVEAMKAHKKVKRTKR